MDKTLLNRDQYAATIADNKKFRDYWNTHPDELKELCQKFSDKYVYYVEERSNTIETGHE